MCLRAQGRDRIEARCLFSTNGRGTRFESVAREKKWCERSCGEREAVGREKLWKQRSCGERETVEREAAERGNPAKKTNFKNIKSCSEPYLYPNASFSSLL